jgi:peptidoglycan hydrolase-like protein with peptidoglycan-binding domain
MKNKGFTISIFIVGAVVIYYYFFRKKAAAAATNLGTAAGTAAVTAAANTAGQIINQTASTISTGSGSGSGTPAGKYTFTQADKEKNLSKGSTGILVTALQIVLKKAGENLPPTPTAADGIDGVFGTDTEKALQSYQDIKYVTLQDLQVLPYELSAVNALNRKIYGKDIMGFEQDITNKQF